MATPQTHTTATATPSTSASASNNHNHSSPPSWRCDDHRLHRFDENCVEAKLTLPLIDTPAKRLRYDEKMARLSQNQDSPSSGRPKPQGSRKTAAVPQSRGRTLVRESIEDVPNAAMDAVDGVALAPLLSPPQGESQLVAGLAGIPAAKNRNVSRESTPLSYVVTDEELANLPPSPVVRPSPPPEGLMSPLALAAQQDDDAVFMPEDDHLQPLLSPNAGRQISEPAMNQTPPATTPIVPQRSSRGHAPTAAANNAEVFRLRTTMDRMGHDLETQTARNARLENRNQIHEVMHSHHVLELSIADRERRQAEFDAERERGRKLQWQKFCGFLIGMAAFYVWWCWHNAPNFRYIKERTEEMFGLKKEGLGFDGE